MNVENGLGMIKSASADFVDDNAMTLGIDRHISIAG
jgi:hypothetical protein